MQRMINIRPFEERDWDATWRIIEPVFRAGETYAFSPYITEEERIRHGWRCLWQRSLLWTKTMMSLAPTTSSQINPLSGLTFVTVVTSFQKTPAAKVLQPKCVNIRNVRPYPEAFEQCSTTWLSLLMRELSASGKGMGFK